MKRAFEVEWMGGAAEHHFRKARPGIEELPWGTLDTRDFPPEIVDAARATWTDSAIAEYRALAAFADVLRSMCEAAAPLDLIGMASSFVADEAVHTELTSRMAMELGGAVERPVDYDAIYPRASRSLTAFQRANETVVRVCCVAEAFSGQMVVSALRSTTHPLTHAVFARIAADESLHYRLGPLYLDWASDEMDDAERARLAHIAADTLARIAPGRLTPPSIAANRTTTTTARARATRAQIETIGWIETSLYGDQARTAIRQSIVEPLARYGIVIPRESLAAIGL